MPGNAQGNGAQPRNPLEPFQRQFQALLDKSTPHIPERWFAWTTIFFIYLLRVYFLEGFYIVTYALGIYNLNLLLGFLTPLHVELQQDDEPTLPSKSDEEFRPFVRRLPEFKFWYASIRSITVGFIATFFSAFDVPVFWPILLLYWFILFSVTMKRQIQHMIKYRYIPFSLGKKKYGKGGGGGGKSNK